jgi:hypothetical protein
MGDFKIEDEVTAQAYVDDNVIIEEVLKGN